VLKPGKFAFIGSFLIAVALHACSWFLGGTKLERITTPFVIPGMFLAAIVFPEGPHSDHAMLWIVLVEIVNLILAWLVLLILFTMFENVVLRIRERE
jgi:hypothetical protein